MRWMLLGVMMWLGVSSAFADDLRYRFFYQPSTGKLLQVIYTTTGEFADDYVAAVSRQFSLPVLDVVAFEVRADERNLEGWRKKLSAGQVPPLPDAPRAFTGVILSPPGTESEMDRHKRGGREKLKALGLTDEELNAMAGR